jgi:hypothetical protein
VASRHSAAEPLGTGIGHRRSHRRSRPRHGSACGAPAMRSSHGTGGRRLSHLSRASSLWDAPEDRSGAAPRSHPATRLRLLSGGSPEDDIGCGK